MSKEPSRKKLISYIVGTSIYAILTTKFKKEISILQIASAIIFSFAKDTSDWYSWFDYAKRYSVVYPTAYVSYKTLSSFKKFDEYIFTVFLGLNILEGGLVEFQSSNRINGLSMIILVFLTKITVVNNSLIIQSYPKLYMMTYSILLSTIHLVSKNNKGNWVVRNSTNVLLLSIWIPVLFGLYKPELWILLRVHLFSMCLIIDSVFPQFNEDVWNENIKIKLMKYRKYTDYLGLTMTLTLLSLNIKKAIV